MIVGIGTDLVEIERVKKAATPHFLHRYFTENERLLFQNISIPGHENSIKAETVAGNFAAKESIAKAFGTGIRGFLLSEIEVLRDEFGKPFVNLYGRAADLSHNLNISIIHISISHTSSHAVAFAVAENNNKL